TNADDRLVGFIGLVAHALRERILRAEIGVAHFGNTLLARDDDWRTEPLAVSSEPCGVATRRNDGTIGACAPQDHAGECRDALAAQIPVDRVDARRLGQEHCATTAASTTSRSRARRIGPRRIWL